MKPPRKVASGTWLYDGIVPRRIEIFAVPAEIAGSRYDDDDELNEASPIPVTADGNVYVTKFGGEGGSLEEAMKWANARSWGPVTWDTEANNGERRTEN